jgi:hypothetical protein
MTNLTRWLGALLVIGVTWGGVVEAATLSVGPTRTYKVPSQAAAVARDGDTIEIDAGTYADVAVWRVNNLTIRGIGGRPHMNATGLRVAADKGIWLIQGQNTTIDNIEFSGARSIDNAAGIRQEGSGVTIRNCYFHDNQNGILGGLDTPGDMIIEYSEFAYNGYGDGQTHNMYVKVSGKFILRYSYLHHAKIGHNVKSRSHENYILYNRISNDQDGNASYEIDIPEGGLTYVIGNTIQQGLSSDNSNLLAYAQEIGAGANPKQELYVINNTFVNDYGAGTFVRTTGTPLVKIYNNIFAGPGTVTNAVAEQKNNIVYSTNPPFVNRAGYDYRLVSGASAIDAGVNPGTASGFDLTPVYQYVHSKNREARVVQGTAIDVGAYEYPQGTVTPPMPPPAITSQPANTTVIAPAMATFNVAVSGTAPLSYQWQKNGVTISGATTASYTTPATSTVDSGSSYRVVVTNSAGSVTSSAALLTVNAAAVAPTITSQPANMTMIAPAMATFNVAASGTAPLSYQWQKNGIIIAGATSASYTTPATSTVDSGSSYRVVVSNSVSSVTSSAALLTVNAAAVAPAITSQPVNMTMIAPAMATFSVTASGTAPLSYQWQKNGITIAGATSASYTTPATSTVDSGSSYRVVVSNSVSSVTSSAATLTVNGGSATAAVMVNSSSAPSTVAPGTMVNVGVQNGPGSSTDWIGLYASGSADTALLNWVYLNGAQTPPVAGLKTAIVQFTMPSTAGTHEFRFFANNSYTKLATSPTVTVNALVVAPAITSQPANMTMIAPAMATFNVAASGTAPLSYQWQKNGVTISGATSASYTTPATSTVDSGSSYRVVVSNSVSSVTSSAAMLTVNAAAVAPTITSQPANMTMIAPATATFNVTASGTAPLSYQWQKNGLTISGATSASYTTPATSTVDSGSSYRVVVSNSVSSVTSSAATLMITNGGTAALTFTYNGTLRDKVGQNNRASSADGVLDGTFTLTLAGGGPRTLTGLEFRNSPGGVWDTQAATAYWTLGVANGLDSALLNPGDNVSTAMTTGGSVTLFAADWNNSMFKSGVSFTVTATFADGTSATATTTVSGTSTPATVTLAYNGKLRDKVGQNNTAARADSALDGTFTLTRGAGGGAPTVIALDLRRTGGGVWDTLPTSPYWTLGVASSLDGALLNPADAVNIPLTAGGSVTLFGADYGSGLFVTGSIFTLTVTFADGMSATATTTVSGTSTPTITSQPVSATVMASGSATFGVTASGSAPLSYQWQKNGAIIAGATSASYTTPATSTVDSGSNYRVVVSNNVSSVTSSAAMLTVNAPAVAPTITTQPANLTVIVPATATFNVTVSGTAPLSYQWQKNGVTIPGATSASYTMPATSTGDSGSSYRVVVSNIVSSVTSSAAMLTVNRTSTPTGTLSYNGKTRDAVGQGNIRRADGVPDGVFTVSVNTSVIRTVTKLVLQSTNGTGTWDTDGNSGYWSLGAALSGTGTLLNAANDVVTFPVAAGSSTFTLFAGDAQGGVYFPPGRSFMLTATFSDGTSATATATVSATPLTSTPLTSRVLSVGPTRTYKVPSQAAVVAQDGDTIEIDAGTYADVATWRADNLTIRGIGGRPHINAAGLRAAADKGTWLIQGQKTTIENVEFSGSKSIDKDGAGIRQEGSGVTIRNCYFHDNENGIRGGNYTSGDMIIEYSEFAHNGFGDGYSHNISVAVQGKFILRYNYIHHAKIGHNVKTRSHENYILYNRISNDQDGTASYEIDIPNGGLSYVIGNIIQQGPANDNSNLLAYGQEIDTGANPKQELYVINNTFVNDSHTGTFVRTRGTPLVKLFNNIFAGPGMVTNAVAEQKNNIVYSTNAPFVNRAGYDYRLVSGASAIDSGVNPGTDFGFDLTPVYQYVHSKNREARVVHGTASDVGAYEYPQGVVTTSP